MDIGINDDTSQLEVRNITIKRTQDVEFRISINFFGELVIKKIEFGTKDSSLIIKTSESNEIRVL